MTKVSIQNHAPDLTWRPEPQRWPVVFPPVCASAWGDDRFGLWIDVVLGGPVQRFRWIEPGEFWMGSLEGEVGRFDNEGLQHQVHLADGCWLAETACNQAIWRAVMGNNPSRFKSDPENPVERVSWDEVQGFLREVEKSLPGVKADLPTEAEWEYACRAGSKNAFSWGSCITPNQANYDATVSYAKGPTSAYLEKTVPVKSYSPNAWGLYQMHGNVWEWCADGLRDYDGAPQIDPRGPVGAEADAARAVRAVRGGSWFNDPHGLRAAYRNRRRRDERVDSQGFRFLLVPRRNLVRPPEAVVTRDA